MSRHLDYATPRGFTRPRTFSAANAALLLAWLVAAAALFGCLSGILAGVVVPVAALGPIVVILLVAGASYAARAARRGRMLTVLSYLEQGLCLNLPLPQFLQAAEQSEKPALARQLRDLRELIQAGSPIAVAVEHVPNVPRRLARLIHVAERTGRLPRMLRHELKQARGRAAEESDQGMFAVAYPLAMLTMLVVALGLLLAFVFPEFDKIFRDFGVPLPMVYQWTTWVGGMLAIPMIMLVAAILWFYVAMKLWSVFLPLPRPMGSELLDRLVWRTPVLGEMAYNRGLADVCRVSGEALDNGYDLAWALGQSRELKLNAVLAQRVKRWHEQVVSGASADEAARRAGLPELVSGTLASAGGAMAQALQYLARYYEARYSRRAALLRGAVVPAMTLAGGGLVALVTLSVIVPLVRLVFVLLPDPGAIL